MLNDHNTPVKVTGLTTRTAASYIDVNPEIRHMFVCMY